MLLPFLSSVLFHLLNWDEFGHLLLLELPSEHPLHYLLVLLLELLLGFSIPYVLILLVELHIIIYQLLSPTLFILTV